MVYIGRLRLEIDLATIYTGKLVVNAIVVQFGSHSIV